MPVKINTKTYYRTVEVCRIAGISRTTLFRWLREGIVREPDHRDRRGWRLFTQDELDKLKAEVSQINTTNSEKSPPHEALLKR